jgi:secreted trypsin-like serine protease
LTLLVNTTAAGGAIGGAPVPVQDFPATGVLLDDVGAQSPHLVCTATLIAARAAITAAHCVTYNVQSLRFTLASDPLGVGVHDTMPVERAYLHPSFHSSALGSLADIALVELATPSDILPATWLTPELAPIDLHAGGLLDLIGFGATTAPGGHARHKNRALGRIARVSSNELVVGGPGESQSCIGDSGGPSYLLSSDGTRRIAGIVSRSANDKTECVDGSIQTRVDAYAPWIAATLTTIAQHGAMRARRSRLAWDTQAVVTEVVGLVALLLVFAIRRMYLRYGSIQLR